MSADIVIRGGIVVDGSGEPGREADVAITGDRVSEIGSGLSGKVELDAGGQVVAPGFIDIHTHYDAQVFWDPALTPSCYHGVTSVIAGNCGFSIAPTRPSHQDLIARTLCSRRSPRDRKGSVSWARAACGAKAMKNSRRSTERKIGTLVSRWVGQIM